MLNILKDILTGFWSLIVGLGVTGKTGVEPAVTEQYPNDLFDHPFKRHGRPHREVSDRYRGLLAVTWDWERGSTTCIACQACAQVCPSRCIDNIVPEGKGKERRAASFRISLLMCCYCGLCEEVCPVDGKAIFLTRDYDLPVSDPAELLVQLDWLTDRGQRFRPAAEGVAVAAAKDRAPAADAPSEEGTEEQDDA
jgi:NADH-quinone oxidoreductase subunit I